MARWMPASLTALLALVPLSAGRCQAAAPTLEEQAAEIAAYARQTLGDRRPGWPVVHREQWSGAIGEAIV